MDKRFEWDKNKEIQNIARHGVSFEEAREAFGDEDRIISSDYNHSTPTEQGYYCFGLTKRGIITVCFTYRAGNIRIISANYRREGKKVYEKKKKSQRNSGV